MSLTSIRTNLESIDYKWNKPQTYLVFIPGLSLIIQKIQLANTLPLIANPTTKDIARQADAKSRKFADICKWHLRGSLLQVVTIVIAVKVVAAPILSLLLVVTLFELLDTSIKALKNQVTFYDFELNGLIKITASSAFNIF